MIWPVGVVMLLNITLAQLGLGGLDLGVLDFKGPDGVGCLDVLVDQGHVDQAVVGGTLGRPVQVTFALKKERTFSKWKELLLLLKVML